MSTAFFYFIMPIVKYTADLVKVFKRERNG